MKRSNTADRFSKLAPRARTIMEYACAGATGKWTAHEMGLSPQTVKNVRSESLRFVFGAPSMIELVLRRQEERMETGRYVVIGKYEDSTNTIVVSREIVAPSAELAEALFKMAFEGEGMGAPIIEATYGPYAVQA